MSDDLSFGQWLKRQRRRLDLTQEELATRVGYATTTIRRVEADELKPSKELADKLAVALDLPPDERDAFVRFARGERGAALPLPQRQLTPTPPVPSGPPVMRHNLPVQLSSFIGREREMDRLQTLLDTSRLVTLTGVGGTGKTRLALEVASRLVDRYPHGVWLVELASLMDPALVPQAIATALTVRDEPGRPLLAALTDYLREKRLLLILDNCEHLIEACAQVVESLLRACPRLQVVATGREALGLVGETIFQVPSLSLPERDASLPDRLTQSEAARLFVERARAVQPDFAVTGETAPPIVQICYRLDGIPLALELAAARTRTLPIAQIAALIDDRFRLLTGGSRTALSRHRTLQGLIDWSYSLLTEAERTLLQRLSVFAGGWTLEAAEAVCADEDGGRKTNDQPNQASLVGTTEDGRRRTDVLDVLTRLVEKSLVQVESQGTEARYRLLETIRQYARDKLLEAGAAEVIQDRHLAYYVALAEEGDIKLRGPEQMAWFQRLETEHDNLRAALAWSQTSPEGGEAGLRLVGALGWFWHQRGYGDEGRRWLDEAPGHPQAAGRTAARARALSAAYFLGRTHELGMRARLVESETIWREVGDRHGLAWTIRCREFLAMLDGEWALARERMKESLALYESVGDRWGMAWVYDDQGILLFLTRGSQAEARRLFEMSLTLFDAEGDYLRRAMVGTHLAYLDAYEGQPATARRRFEERLAVARQMGDRSSMMGCLDVLALLAARQGESDKADELHRESLVLRYEAHRMDISLLPVIGVYLALWQGDHDRAAALLPGYSPQAGWAAASWIAWAGVALLRGQLVRAATLLGAAERDMALGRTRMLLYEYEYDHYLTQVRAHLDEQPFSAAWVAGQAMTLEQAIAYALSDTGSTSAEKWPGLP